MHIWKKKVYENCWQKQLTMFYPIPVTMMLFELLASSTGLIHRLTEGIVNWFIKAIKMNSVQCFDKIWPTDPD